MEQVLQLAPLTNKLLSHLTNTIMKKKYLILAFYWLNSSVSFSQVVPNSNRFDIENYIAIDNTGNYYPYTAHGFY